MFKVLHCSAKQLQRKIILNQKYVEVDTYTHMQTERQTDKRDNQAKSLATSSGHD